MLMPRRSACMYAHFVRRSYPMTMPFKSSMSVWRGGQGIGNVDVVPALSVCGGQASWPKDIESSVQHHAGMTRRIIPWIIRGTQWSSSTSLVPCAMGLCDAHWQTLTLPEPVGAL